MGDVRLLGPWTFTLQSETPLYWLKCGPLSHYLLKVTVSLPSADNIYCGIVIHSPSESTGMEGASLWLEHKDGMKRYAVGGNDLKSDPISSKVIPQVTPWKEDWELLVQGYDACWFLKNRTVRISFKLSREIGCIAIFNSTRGSDESETDVMFKNARLTVLAKGIRTQPGSLLPSFPYVNIPKTADAPRKPLAFGLGATTPQQRPRTQEAHTRPNVSHGHRTPLGERKDLAKPRATSAGKAADSRNIEGRQAVRRPHTTIPQRRVVQIPTLSRPLSRSSDRNFPRPKSRGSQLPKGSDFWPIPDFFEAKSHASKPSRNSERWKVEESITILKKDLEKELNVVADLDRQIAAMYKALFHSEEMRERVADKENIDIAEQQKKSIVELEKYKESCENRIGKLEEEIGLILKKDLRHTHLSRSTEELIRSRVRLIDTPVATPVT